MIFSASSNSSPRKNLGKNFLVVTIVTIIGITILISPSLWSLLPKAGVLALDTGLNETAGAAQLPTTGSIATITGQIIYAILGFLGVIFILLLIYGGFLRMTAQGDPGKIKTSNGIITSAVIGVIIILASYTITAFVLGRVGASVGEGEELGGEEETKECIWAYPPCSPGSEHPVTSPDTECSGFKPTLDSVCCCNK